MKYIVIQEKSAMYMYAHTGSHVQFPSFVLVVLPIIYTHCEWFLPPPSPSWTVWLSLFPDR